MDLQFVAQFMLQNFELTTVSNNGTHFLSRCILCGDSQKNPYKKRFNLDWNDGVPGWHCFNCGRKGNFIEIYSIVKGLSYDDAKKELFKWRSKEETKRLYKRDKKAISSVSINIEKEKEEREYDDFNWIRESCYGTHSKGEGILEKRYLKILYDFYESRKIPLRYKIYVCFEGTYKNRIIIPIFNDKNRIIYFQARRIPKSGIEPKYDNPISPKELCILNKHKFNKDLEIIVHEGLLDAFTVGDQATSCLGKEISEELIAELLKLTTKNVIIALDNDSEAYKALAKFMKKNKYAKKLKYFLYPQQFEGYDDINSYVSSKEQGINVFELITQNSVSYSTAYTKLSIQKLLGGNRNENNKHRNRLH